MAPLYLKELIVPYQPTRAGVFNVFQAKGPQTDGEMEQGPPTI